MEDILCKCSKKCFCYTTFEKQEDKLLKFIIYKCNYLYNSDKKNSCDFYKKVNIKNNLDDVEMNDNIASETNEKSDKIENNENNEKNDNTIKTARTARTAKTARTKVIIYKEDVESKIEKLLKIYEVGGTNFFGVLNYNLNLLGYSIHQPNLETLDELVQRMNKERNIMMKKDIKFNKGFIKVNKDSCYYKNIGEHDFDEDELKCMFDKINIKETSLDWVDDDVKNIIKSTNIPSFKKLRKKEKKNKNLNKNNVDNYIDNDIDIENEYDDELSSNNDSEEEKEEKEENNNDSGDELEEDDYDEDNDDYDNDDDYFSD